MRPRRPVRVHVPCFGGPHGVRPGLSASRAKSERRAPATRFGGLCLMTGRLRCRPGYVHRTRPPYSAWLFSSPPGVAQHPQRTEGHEHGSRGFGDDRVAKRQEAVRCARLIGGATLPTDLLCLRHPDGGAVWATHPPLTLAVSCVGCGRAKRGPPNGKRDLLRSVRLGRELALALQRFDTAAELFGQPLQLVEPPGDVAPVGENTESLR